MPNQSRPSLTSASLLLAIASSLGFLIYLGSILVERRETLTDEIPLPHLEHKSGAAFRVHFADSHSARSPNDRRPAAIDTARRFPRGSLISEIVETHEEVREIIASLLQRYQHHLHLPSKAQREKLVSVILEESRRYNFDPFFILSVMFAESGLDTYAVSSAGALGLMQIMPKTGKLLARQLDLRWQGAHTLLNPLLNVQMGIYYLYQLRRRFRPPHQYLAAYNEGPERIERKLRQHREIHSEYTRKILAYYHHFSISPRTKNHTNPSLY